jgi:hypothetical protein
MASTTTHVGKEGWIMNKRLQRLGLGLALMGIVFFAAGGYTLYALTGTGTL